MDKQPIGTFTNPYDASVFINSEHKALQDICTVANEEAFEYCEGERSTCILSSYALVHVLKRKGYDAKPLRVETGVFPKQRRHIGTVLGSSRQRTHAAGKGMWGGHLVVGVGTEWLLDPTLDQANKDDEWDGLKVTPIAVKLFPGFWKEETVFLNFEQIMVRYSLHHRQNGFKNAPDARPSRWRPLSEMILDRIER